MSLTVALTAAQEQRLIQEAKARHVDTNILLQQLVDAALARLEPPVIGERIPDLHPGHIISDDFDAPLPDEFWLGVERDCSSIRIPFFGGIQHL